MTVRVLMIIGSGETDRAMTTIHKRLLARLEPPVRAAMLDTPYGFQENADLVTERLLHFFDHHVGIEVKPVGLRRADTRDPLLVHDVTAALRSARWVFAGPGSPSYALAHWRETPVPDLLRGRLREGGALVFASAAACTLGRLAVPVYEIYKAGHDPAWIDGLDLLAEAGLDVAVVPHFDNRDGRGHDTRFCYLGERRLRALEDQLPAGTAILGVDELTACTLDLDADTLAVEGRGAVTLRVAGESHAIGSGETVALEEVRRLVARGADTGPGPVPGRAGAGTSPGAVPGRAGAGTSPGAVPGRAGAVGTADPKRWRPAFEEAVAEGRLRDACRVVLDLEDALAGAEAVSGGAAVDGAGSPGGGARAALRGMIHTLSELAADTGDDLVADLVGLLVDIRDALRARGEYGLADHVRDRLAEQGFEVRDTPDGTIWLAPER